ncbi:MAG: helix-turn-helix domain-containing protein [Acidimicrobiales bacterium]
MLDLDVIDAPDAAVAALDPVRARILQVLAEPGSATTVAAVLGLSRQKVNYHLRTLEDHGLVELVEERPRRGFTERIVQATARSYLVGPDTLGEVAPDPTAVDRLSSRYLIALAARLVREVSGLARGAERAGKRLPLLALDTEIRFASAADRAAFTDELATIVTDLVARHHDERAPGGRWHRLVVAAHPIPPPGSSREPATEPATEPTTDPSPPPEGAEP